MAKPKKDRSLDTWGGQRCVTDKDRKRAGKLVESLIKNQQTVLKGLMDLGYTVPEAIYQMNGAALGAVFMLKVKAKK